MINRENIDKRQDKVHKRYKSLEFSSYLFNFAT